MLYEFHGVTDGSGISSSTPNVALASTQRKIKNCKDFLAFFHEITSGYVSYDASFFGKGVCHSLGVSLDLEITDNLPSSYRKGIRTAAGGVKSPPLSSWLLSGRPLLVNVSGDDCSLWEKNFINHGYENMAVHGFTDDANGRMSIFGVYNCKSESDISIMNFLGDIAVEIHNSLYEIPQTLEREFHALESQDATSLTEREKEIVYWVGQGKTNSGIALILGISANTVRNHLYNASEKLSAGNRVELVSFAVRRLGGV